MAFPKIDRGNEQENDLESKNANSNREIAGLDARATLVELFPMNVPWNVHALRKWIRYQ
jgi:hypothetical protein